MTSSFGHHVLHNRYRFGGKLQLDTPLRLSSGRASDLTDAPLMRNRAGVPFIPGSSLRGAIRSAIERLIGGAGPASGLCGCVLFSDDDCAKKALKFQRDNDPNEDAIAEFAARELCDICRLFGCTIYASRLVIEDAYPVKTKDELQRLTQIRDCVGIDRDTGTAREGVKFDFEVLEAGPELAFCMQAENVDASVGAKDRQLIDLILALLKQGLNVGGKQAAGLGRVSLVGDCTVKGFKSPDTLWAALKAGKDPHQDLKWLEVPQC